MRPLIARKQLSDSPSDPLPEETSRGRFDAEAFYAALDAERRSRQYTWKQVAGQAKGERVHPHPDGPGPPPGRRQSCRLGFMVRP